MRTRAARNGKKAKVRETGPQTPKQVSPALRAVEINGANEIRMGSTCARSLIYHCVACIARNSSLLGAFLVEEQTFFESEFHISCNHLVRCSLRCRELSRLVGDDDE